ncbi:response regulator transcription factor [Paenibacillus rigui]|uniref:DNA-binding response regulator n=1 Tax=Paenibacillus rigui TaxID=554312 RepID=A0A229UUJ7_9BACL|nr:response regulator [Paenibacillus rigui]OXM86589.1 hypothetical protein CF651_09045 [Paenibacillus rigui]
MLNGNVLIVEDQPNFRRGLMKMMEGGRLGWNVAGEAANGHDALTMLDQVRPDLVLTDIRMPVMDGLEFVGHLRQKYPELLVVIITAYKNFEYAQAAVRHGVLDLLVKPCKEEDVRQVLSKAADRFIQRRKQLLPGHHEGPQPGSVVVLNQSRAKELEAQLMSAILTGQAEVLEQLLHQRIAELSGIPEAELKLQALSLTLALQATIQKQFQTDRFPSADSGVSDRMPQPHWKAEEVLVWVKEQVLSFMRLFMQWQASSKQDNVIERAMQYVEEHYHEECRLTDLADYVHMNPSYFSVLFKKTTGDSFTSYVTRLRMDKAALLLRNTDMRIFEIACAVGFDEPNYFTNVFKQQFRMSPKEYRKIPVEEAVSPLST